MMENIGSLVHTHTASAPTTSLRVKLALAPDPTQDYTDMLREIIDLAFAASASMPVEIIIVDPADSEQTTGVGIADDVPASLVAPTSFSRQISSIRTRWTKVQRRAPRLAARAVAS